VDHALPVTDFARRLFLKRVVAACERQVLGRVPPFSQATTEPLACTELAVLCTCCLEVPERVCLEAGE